MLTGTRLHDLLSWSRLSAHRVQLPLSLPSSSRLDKRGIGPFVDLTPWIRRVRLLRVVLGSLVRSAFHLDDTHRTISTFLGVHWLVEKR